VECVDSLGQFGRILQRTEPTDICNMSRGEKEALVGKLRGKEVVIILHEGPNVHVYAPSAFMPYNPFLTGCIAGIEIEEDFLIIKIRGVKKFISHIGVTYKADIMGDLGGVGSYDPESGVLTFQCCLLNTYLGTRRLRGSWLLRKNVELVNKFGVVMLLLRL